MLIYSMSVSVDGFIADREGGFDWTRPDDDLFRFHLAEVGGLGAYLLGRRLYETMLVWETDPSLRSDEDRDAFAAAWGALPKVVFSRTLDRVEGSNVRLAEGSVAEEVAAALGATDKPVSIGGAALAAEAIEQGLVDELRTFRCPVVVGGGTPYLPPVTEDIPLDLVETQVRLGRALRALRPRSRRGGLSRRVAVVIKPARRGRHHLRIAPDALPDIETAADCERLVRAFYGKAMADEAIGWIFTDVAELDLEEHIPVIASFWATNLLGAKSYSGGAFGVHAELHQKAGGLRKEHFERWLVLWCQTVDELFDGPVAAAAKVHALRVANAFYGRLQMFPVADEAAGAAGP